MRAPVAGAALAAGALVLLAGCAIGPSFKRPQPAMPAAWSGTGPAAPGQPSVAAPDAIAVAAWWAQLGDPKLTALVTEAAQANLDVRAAEARLRQARAARGVAASGFWPGVSASGSYSRAHTPGPGGAHDLFRTGLDAAWELDLFGGTRRGVEAANADIESAFHDRRDLLVSLAAEVTVNYVDLRAFQERLRIAQENLQSQRHSASLTRQRLAAGLASGLDTANADAQVATTEAALPVLETGARQAVYALSVLLARPPAALLEELAAPAPLPETPAAAPVGLPSDLLQRRPDIRRAEAQLHSATARIGVAEADLFPRFSLTGAGGYESANLGSLIRSSSLFWSVGPSVNWQLFSAGRVRSNIELQKAVREETLLAYQRSVLTALQDVENGLVSFAREQQRRQRLAEAVAANRKAVTLATQLYAEGQTDFLNVIEAQRSLYGSEDALVQSRQAVVTDFVALYKALGGGWEMLPDPAP